MEKLPYIDGPLPMISMRQEWQLFSWRTLPPITARMSQEELVQLIGDIPPAKSSSQMASAPDDAPHDNPSATSDRHASGRTEEAPAGSARSPPPGKHRLKPPGQPNRPGSGGYNLEKHLLEQCGWTQEDFQAVQKRVHALAAERLDVSKCYRDQRGATVTAICEAVKKDHAIARGFEQCWVIKDMLIIHLKNTSEASRRRKVKRRTEPECPVAFLSPSWPPLCIAKGVRSVSPELPTGPSTFTSSRLAFASPDDVLVSVQDKYVPFFVRDDCKLHPDVQ
ncbi:hypothetical protein B0H11DRAFT_2240350 [Mycena galericulata]|nr:hypothetical protein B0H11DRAFT_2240350 [Mycena galericulata]